MEIPLVGKQNQEGFYPVNMYFHPELPNGGAGLMGAPGLTLHKAIASTGEVRGIEEMAGTLYIVVANGVYTYAGGAVTTCTGTIGTSTGHVWMVNNGTQVMIVDGTKGYYVTGTTVTEITDSDFPTPSSLTYQDGYGIITEKDTGKIWLSAINDFSNWDALDYTTAEAMPDYATAVYSDHRELYVFGEKSTETYYNSGNADFPFERIPGGYIERGIGAAHSPVKADNSIVWFTDKRQVIRTMGPGHSPMVISTPQLDLIFAGYTTVSDAYGWGMDAFGFTWYVLLFPTENITWVYNFATQRWHQWAAFSAGVEVRHNSNCYVYYQGNHLVGHESNGNLYKIDPDSYTNYDNTFRAIARFPTIVKEGYRIQHHRFQLDFKAGVGLSTGLATGTAVLTAGVVTSVTIVGGGSGYTTAPTVVFSGGGGSGAIGTANLTGDAVTSVTIHNGGSGYTSAPTCTFVGGTVEPRAMLRWSDDRRQTWSNEHWASIGAIGEYKARAIWRRLGSARQRNYEVTISDAVERMIYGAYLKTNMKEE